MALHMHAPRIKCYPGCPAYTPEADMRSTLEEIRETGDGEYVALDASIMATAAATCLERVERSEAMADS